MLDAREIMELQKLSGMEKFSKLTVKQALDREKLIALLENRRCEASEVCGSMNNGFGAWYADHLIANGVTVQEWISVKDRAPTEKGCYMVAVKHWLDGKPVVREAKWNGADWLSCYKAEELTPRVTHWTYLPQPPKGE